MDLESLKNNQLELAKRLKLEDKININKIKLVAGIDTTFLDPYKEPTLAISCIVVLNLEDFSVVEVVFGQKEIDFPYIPTFLAFREIPSIMDAYQKLKSVPDVFILDGQGILHPRKMGIASHFGVITDTVSIGCGKSLLYGKYTQIENKPMAYNPVYADGELRGYALRVKKNTNPIFISPGNNISLNSSLYVIIKTIKSYKLPEPVRLAHNYLTEYRKKLLQEVKDG
ncbi:endonuclease V [Sulfurihydrogenibium subterraneum]|uniref:endonuclease V n=1 Tax=Sulfurihydrogenibium subterraneum TaxID=171121 RepID=UPI00048B1056|nr:endonuclease V [Sulfurihydrogenibium subterraneum]